MPKNKRTAKKKQKYASKVGLPPGSLIYVGEERTGKSNIAVMDFSSSHFEEFTVKDIADCKVCNNENSTTWIDVEGIHESAVIQEIGEFFKIDQLVMEDMLNTQHRPVFEEHDNYLYLSLKAIFRQEEEPHPIIQQVSLVLGRSWLLSFQENPRDVLVDYKERIRQAKGKIRSQKNDFIFYRLIDNIVDQYFLVTEAISEEMEDLEEKIFSEPDEKVHEHIYRLKKSISGVKKAVLPLREAISSIIRSDTILISKYTRELLRDVYEHVLQISDTVESQRESITDFLNLYMTQLSNKMNEVMKVLTIFASIFIPLTFIAGIYGMNFDYMPELHWKMGYGLVWIIIVAVGVGLFIYFRRKKWI